MLSLLVSTLGIAPESMKTTTHMFSNVDSPLVNKLNLWNLESIGITVLLQVVEYINKLIE